MGLAGKLKSKPYIFGPNPLIPEGRGSQSAGSIIDRFVYHIPGSHFPCITSNQGENVLPENLDHFIAAEVAGSEPAGNLIVPDQSMSAHFHVVCLRELHEGIG